MKFAVATIGVILTGLVMSWLWLCWETTQQAARRGMLWE